MCPRNIVGPTRPLLSSPSKKVTPLPPNSSGYSLPPRLFNPTTTSEISPFFCEIPNPRVVLCFRQDFAPVLIFLLDHSLASLCPWPTDVLKILPWHNNHCSLLHPQTTRFSLPSLAKLSKKRYLLSYLLFSHIQHLHPWLLPGTWRTLPLSPWILLRNDFSIAVWLLRSFGLRWENPPFSLPLSFVIKSLSHPLTFSYLRLTFANSSQGISQHVKESIKQ